MRCIVIDDEPFAREGMKINIEKIDFLELVGSFSNVIDANNFLNTNEIDLLFIDIEMPDITGLEYLATLKKKPLTILATAYPQYALEGFELGVIDYIVKPIVFTRFLSAVNRAKEIFDLEQKCSYQMVEKANNYFYVRSNWRNIKIKYDEVKYIKGLKDYVIIYTVNEHIMTAVNLKTIHLQLPKINFIRINKSYIINVNFVDSVSQEMIQIGNEELILSGIYKDEFYTNFIEKNIIKRYFKEDSED